MKKRLHAGILLAWHLLLHIFAKVTFTYDPGGLIQFRQNYESDGLAPLEKNERLALADWQECIGCRLCESVSPDMKVIPENRPASPSELPISSIRDLSRNEWSAPMAETIRKHYDGEELQAICPEDIDILAIAEFLADYDGRKLDSDS